MNIKKSLPISYLPAARQEVPVEVYFPIRSRKNLTGIVPQKRDLLHIAGLRQGRDAANGGERELKER